DKVVESEKLHKVVEAGLISPSARNRQPWHYYIVTGESAQGVRKGCQVGGANKFLDNVNAFLVVSMERVNKMPSVAGILAKVQDFTQYDIGLSVMQITLACTSLGLSSCILGWFNEKIVQTAISQNVDIALVIAVGYARDEDALRAKVRAKYEDKVTEIK
ncbi:MAG: nitroreductase family protein, partial [Clostridia bacterium]